MNRGSLAEDPREGLSSSSRYSHREESNSLLYVDSSAVRKARKAAESRKREADGTTKGNHSFTSDKSVGRGLLNSHMDRLEVGSDGRLFHVKVNPKPSGHKTTGAEQGAQTAQGVQTTRDAQGTQSAQASASAQASSQQASASAQASSQQASVSAQTAQPPVSAQTVHTNAKPNRYYLEEGYRNPLLQKRTAAPKQAVLLKRPVLSKQDVFPKRITIPKKSGALRVPGKYRTQILAAAAAVLVAMYGYAAYHYYDHFYPGTQFFGIGASGLTVEEIKTAVQAKVDTYSLELAARDPDGTQRNVISAEDVSLRYVDDGSIDRAMEKQNSIAWPLMMIVRALQGSEETLQTSFDRESVAGVVESLPCFREENIIQPEDAKIILTDDGAVVSPEVYGTQLRKDETTEAVVAALETGSTQINLDQLGLYENPAVFGTDLELIGKAQALNKVLGAKITLSMGDGVSETLNSEGIRSLLSKRGSSYFVNEDKVRTYVSRLARRYDTYQSARKFYTSLGTIVNLEEGVGDYGWELDQESMYEQILDAIKGQKQVIIDAIWNNTGLHGFANDIGDTYVEICLTTQTMWFYRNSELVVKTPVVTGNPYAGNETPAGGVWSLKGRQRNALLSGEGYTAPVDYWMPFNGGVGIHDLQSRYWFGGNVYLGGGSHGCINTPLSAVKLIYEYIEVGTPIIVYKDESDTAMASLEGPFDSGSLKTLIEETYGTVEDDGAGSIVYWTAQKKAQPQSVQTTTAQTTAAGNVW